MKVKQGKVHIARPNQESSRLPETYCGLIIEPHDPLGIYDHKKKRVRFDHSRKLVPEYDVCLACLRIVGPCMYERIR